MELEWRNRITSCSSQHPEELPFLGLWYSVKEGTVWPGTEDDLERPDFGSEPTITLCESLRSLAAQMQPLWGEPWLQWEQCVPLDPTIASDLELTIAEKSLIGALPHLETVSHNPRGHLTVNEIREEVGRAHKVSNRAVATLTAHSEDWQTRTFLGVRPKRILESQDRTNGISTKTAQWQRCASGFWVFFIRAFKNWPEFFKRWMNQANTSPRCEELDFVHVDSTASGAKPS